MRPSQSGGPASLRIPFLRLTLLLGLTRSLGTQVVDLEAQRDALTTLFSAVGGPSWVVNSGWTSPFAAAAHCSWPGIYCCPGSACPYPASVPFPGCTKECAVWGLWLANNNLVSRIDNDSIWDRLETLLLLNLQGTCLTLPARRIAR